MTGQIYLYRGGEGEVAQGMEKIAHHSLSLLYLRVTSGIYTNQLFPYFYLRRSLPLD